MLQIVDTFAPIEVNLAANNDNAVNPISYRKFDAGFN